MTLEHSGWELLGEHAMAARSGYDQGWGDVFGRRFHYAAGRAGV